MDDMGTDVAQWICNGKMTFVPVQWSCSQANFGPRKVLLIICLPETSAANILYRRTQRLKKLSGNSKLKCEPELEAEQMTGKEVSEVDLFSYARRPSGLTRVNRLP